MHDAIKHDITGKGENPMNSNQATLQKLEKMKFYGMARAYTNTMETGVKNQFTADELVTHLVDEENLINVDAEADPPTASVEGRMAPPKRRFSSGSQDSPFGTNKGRPSASLRACCDESSSCRR